MFVDNVLYELVCAINKDWLIDVRQWYWRTLYHGYFSFQNAVRSFWGQIQFLQGGWRCQLLAVKKDFLCTWCHVFAWAFKSLDKSRRRIWDKGQLSPNKKQIKAWSLLRWLQHSTPSRLHISSVHKAETLTWAFLCVFWVLAYFLFVYCFCVSLPLFKFPR